DDLLDPPGQRARVTVGDQQARARILERVTQFRLSVARVQGHHHASRRRHRQVDLEVPVAVRRQDGNAVARPEAKPGQAAGEATAATRGLGVGEADLPGDYGDGVGEERSGAV